MVDRRTVVLASAILLLFVVGVAGNGHEELLEYSARVVAELTDIEGIPIEVTVGLGRAPPSSEQLVEGHTVFHTMDIIPPAPLEGQEINIHGFVECRWDIEGLKLPPGFGVDRVYVECNTGGRIFVTPDDRARPLTRAELRPTGWEKLVPRADGGPPVLVTEHEYWTTMETRDGRERVKAYAWETYVVAPGVNPHTGKSFNFVGTVNGERLREMGTDRLRITTEDQLFLVPSR